MLALPGAIKERYQRFQVQYHVRLLHRYDDIILVGFHIEEAIYGPRYYYPGLEVTYERQIEPEFPGRCRAGAAHRASRGDPRPHGSGAAPPFRRAAGRRRGRAAAVRGGLYRLMGAA